MSKFISKIRIRVRNIKALYLLFHALNICYMRIAGFPSYIHKIRTDIKSIESLNNDVDRCWFMCVPSHGNLGDQAMCYSARRWISENYDSYDIIEISRESITAKFPNVINRMKKVMRENDIIFVQGGYTSCDKSPNEIAHRILASNFKNRIVFFPQTVYYTNQAEKEKTALIYNKHGRILFLARDRISFNTVASSFTGIKCLLYPDIVSSIIGRTNLNLTDFSDKSGILLCIREDSEKKYSQKEVDKLKVKLEGKYTVSLSDLMMNRGNLSPTEYQTIIFEMIERMSKFKVVVTDRFHGILFGLLSGAKVCAIDSIDFKVREGASMFGDLYKGAVVYSKNIEDATNIIDYLYSQTDYINIDDICYQRYYSNLKSLIDNL